MKKEKFEIKNLIRNKQGKFARHITEKNIKLGKWTLIAFVFIILVSLFTKGINKTVDWFRLNTILFKSPITISFQKPVEVISLEELSVREAMDSQLEDISNKVLQEYLNPTTLPKCQDSVEEINPTTFFNKIRAYESSNGENTNPVALHNYCKAKGKWNEIGYNPQGKYCFNSETEARLFVAYYLEKNCSDMTLEGALCYWNTGKIVPTCAYSQGNLSLAN